MEKVAGEIEEPALVLDQTEEEKKLFEKLSTVSSFNPRKA